MKKYLILLFVLLFTCNAYATDIYVATTGHNDTGDGSFGNPYLSIQKGVDTASAGDTVIVKDGTYTNNNDGTPNNGTYETDEDIFVNINNKNGSAGNYITIKAQNKWLAIIDGQSNTTGCIPFHTADCIVYGFTIQRNSSYIKIQDFEIKNIQTDGIFTNNKINATTGDNQSHHLIFSGNKIHDIGHIDRVSGSYNTGGGHSAFYVDGSFNVTIDSNEMYNIGRTPSNNPTDDYNKDHAIYAGASYALADFYGTHTGANNQAILTDSNNTPAWPSSYFHGYISNITDGSSCKITANTPQTVTCTLSGGTDNDWDTGDVYSLSPFYNIDILNNVFYNNTAGWNIEFGCATYANCQNVNIFNNTIDGNPGGATVRDGGIHLGFKFGNQDATTPPTLDLSNTTSTSGLLIINNIFYNSGTYTIANENQYNSNFINPYGDGYVWNNLMYNSSGAQPNIFSNNLGSCTCPVYHSPDCLRSDYSHCGSDNWSASNNTIGSDPLFTSASGHDYTLTSGSPAINGGINYAGRTVDANGVAINGVQDIGAYEISYTVNPQTNLSAANITPDNGGVIHLSWTVSNTSGVTNQYIYRSTVSGSYGSTPIQTINNNTTAVFNDSGLTNGTIYYYVLTATDGTITSAYSTEVNATPVSEQAPITPNSRDTVTRTPVTRTPVTRSMATRP